MHAYCRCFFRHRTSNSACCFRIQKRAPVILTKSLQEKTRQLRTAIYHNHSSLKSIMPYLRCLQSQSTHRWDPLHQQMCLSHWHGLQGRHSCWQSFPNLKALSQVRNLLFKQKGKSKSVLLSGNSLYCFRLRASSAMYLQSHIDSQPKSTAHTYYKWLGCALLQNHICLFILVVS